MVPVLLTGTRDCEHRSRARTPRRFRHPEVAPGVPILRQAQDPYAASDASSVHDRGNETTSLGLSKNPAFASSTTHRATPRGMFPDRPSRGRHTIDSTALKGGETTLRPSWGRPWLLFSVSRRPRSHETHCALLRPQRVDGARSNTGLLGALRVREDPTV